MGALPRRPPVALGSPLGLLLLFVSALALGRASLRLLDHPAPVCSQQVRPRGAREVRTRPEYCGGEGERGQAARNYRQGSGHGKSALAGISGR